MNIVTQCYADNWVDTHLSRWRSTLYRHVPDANVYLIMPYKDDTLEDTKKTAKRIAAHFTDIKLVRIQPANGFQIWLDSLRANTLRAFGIDEVLYLDADVDVVADISDIPAKAPEADIIWTPNAVCRDAVTRALTVYGLPDRRPYVEPAVLYLRRDFDREYEAVINDNKLDWNDYLPSVNVWNVILGKYVSDAKKHMLPGSYNLMAQTITNNHVVKDTAHIVHFCGPQVKRFRMYYDLSNWPSSVTLQKDGKLRDTVDWSQPYGG